MRIRTQHALLASVFCLTLAAQTTEPKEVIGNGGLNHMLHAAPVTGLPFSAEQVMKHSRHLEQGANMTHFGHHFVARDNAGRVRVEQPCGCAEGERVIAVYVLDPIAHTLTTWKYAEAEHAPVPKIAYVAQVPDNRLPGETEPIAEPVRTRTSSRPQPIVTTAELPVEVIDDLPMKVVKTTTIVPAGRSNNDAPITKTHTVWTSQDFKLTFMEEWDDPRIGVRTVGLANFSRKPPDPALFRAPAGYQVKDAKESLKELADRLAASQSGM
jgi:hypothetical protein